MHTDWNRAPAPMTADDLEIGRRYSVYQEWTTDGAERTHGWSANGVACERRFGGYSTHARTVLAVNGETVTAVNFYGETAEIPAAAFGAEIPFVEYLPGTRLRVDGRIVTVADACDMPDGSEVYTVRTRSHRDVFLKKTRAHGWRYGKTAREVTVKRA